MRSPSMRSPCRYAVFALVALPRIATGQLPAGIPPEPASDAELPAIGAWLERWLPVVGVASYPTVDSTADFFAYSTDSVTAARLDGCTLVLHERTVQSFRGETRETRLIVRVPLAQIDTDAVQPRIRRSQVLLSQPNVLLSGVLVVPLRSRTRSKFISLSPDPGPPGDTLVTEHFVPVAFAEVAGVRSALALRQAAARCTGD